MKCYVFAVGNIPDPFTYAALAQGFVDFLNSLKGLVGVHPHYPQGTLLAFDTLENAEYARNQVIESGNQAAHYIMNAEVSADGLTLTVNGPAKDCRQ